MSNIPFPDKKYQIIYADPPWDVMRGPDYNSNGPSKPLPYPTMNIEDIKNLSVKKIVEKNAHLYLWTINKYIEQTYEIARCWGFKPSCLLTWCKPKHGMGIGGTYIQTTEHLLFCRRGILTTLKRVDTTWFEHKRLKHSEKPNMFREMIVSVSGDLPRIELFARPLSPMFPKTEGWDVWGDEICPVYPQGVAGYD